MSNATRPRRAVPIRSHQVNAPASPIWDEIRAAAQQGVYLATLVLAAVSAALLIAPVGYHRTVFRQRLRPQLVNTGHRHAIAGLFVLLWFVIPLVDRVRPQPGMGTRRSIGAWPGRPPTSPTSRAGSPW
jgi:hypothetical protein